jgi:hypothetical protein
VTGLLTRHCHLKDTSSKWIHSPICERCVEKDEPGTHILCDCEATACLRVHHLGRYYNNAPVIKILHFIWSVGFLKGSNKDGCTIDHWKSWCKGWSRPTPYTFMHSMVWWQPPCGGNSILSHAMVSWDCDMTALKDKTERHAEGFKKMYLRMTSVVTSPCALAESQT